MAYLTPDEFAKQTGAGGDGELRELPSSSLGAGWGAGKANWQAGMASLLQALGVNTNDFIQRKKAEAEFYQRNSPGATSFFGEGGVTEDGKVSDWLAYNAGQSAPYMLEMLAGGITGGLARGAGASLAKGVGKGAVEREVAKNIAERELAGEAMTAATEKVIVDQAVRDIGSRWAAGAGAGIASYPSAVGDILMNQADAGGENLGAAMAGGVPYAALNLLGGEGAVLKAATGGLGRAKGIIRSAPGAIARTGLAEGGSETAQEVINQTFGRTAVNPNETLASGDAPMRYAESFMAGLGMGGVMGGGAHVFSKPQMATSDDIAQRADSTKRTVDQVLSGNETWRETLERGRAEEADYQKELEAERADAQKAALDRIKAEQDAAKAAADAEKAAVDARHKAWLANQDQQIRLAMGEMERPQDSGIGTIQNQMFDVPPTGFIPAPTIPGVRAEADAAMQNLVKLAKSKRPVAPEKIQSAMAEQSQLAAMLNTMLEDARASRRAPEVAGGSMDYLRAINDAQSAALEAKQAEEVQATLNRLRPTPVRTAMEEAMLGALKPLQENAAWRKFLADKEAQKRAEMDAAFAQQPAGAPVGKELLGVQGDMIGFGDMTGDEIAAAKRDQQATGVQQPALSNINEFITTGLQISSDWEKARAAGDKATLIRLEKDAEALYEQMAVGFPKATGTDEMFQLREGEVKPRVTPAARIASGNWFKQPKPKETASGTQTAQAQQAEPAAPAVPQQAAAPATGDVSDAAKKLAAKFNKRKTLTPEEAQRVLDEEAAAQPKEPQNGVQEAGQAPAQKVEPTPVEPAPAPVITPAAPRTQGSEMEQINSRIADLEAKQEEDYLPGRAELLDRLYDRAARLEEKAAGLREQQGMTAKEIAAESVIDDAMQEVVEPARFGKGEPGILTNETSPDYPLEAPAREDAGVAVPWIKDFLMSARNPSLLDLLKLVSEKENDLFGQPVLSRLSLEMMKLTGMEGIKVEFNNKRGINAEGKEIGGEYNPSTNTVYIYRGGMTSHIVMHELVHAVTQHRIEQAEALREEMVKDSNRKFTPEEDGLMDAYARLRRLRMDALIAAEKRGMPSQYGLRSGKNEVSEFVAEAMTNSAFQDFLRTVQATAPASKPSIWQDFVAAVKSLLGLTGKELDSVLARVLETVPEMVATRKAASFHGMNVVQHAMPASINQVSNSFIPQNSAMVRAMERTMDFAIDNMPLIGRSGLTKAVKGFRTALEWTHTQRGAAMIHPQLGKIVSEASEMLRRKEQVLTSFNELQRRYLKSQRPVNLKGDLSEVGKYVNDMIDGTMNHYSEGIPKEVEKEMTRLAKEYLMNDKTLFSKNEISGMPQLLPELRPKTRLSREQFKAGVKIAKQQRTVEMPAGMTDAQFEDAYAAYESAMDTTVAAHLQRLMSAEQQAKEMLKGEERSLPKHYKGEALATMKDLRALYSNMYTRISTLDLSKPKTNQLDNEVAKTLEDTGEALFGLLNPNNTAKFQTEKDAALAKNLGMTIEQLKNKLAPLARLVEDKDSGGRMTLIKQMRSDIVGAAQVSRVKEARVYTAMKELFGMYIPARRNGDWTMRLKLVDEKGNSVSGTVTMADGTKQPTDAVLDVWQLADRPGFEAEEVMNVIYADLNKELEKEGSVITVESPEFDESGAKRRDKAGKEITHTIKAKLQWTAPERTRNMKSIAQRVSPLQMLTNLEVLGIQLDPNQRERLIIGATNQEAAIRGRLMKHYVPGYDTNFSQVLSDYLGSVASSIAISEYAHRLQLDSSDKADGWKWEPENEDALKAKVAERDAATGVRKEYLDKEVKAMEFDKRRMEEGKKDLPAIQSRAVEYVEYILGQDQIDERMTGLTKARSIVTILQLGGTLASPLTNLSSIPLHTFSYLVAYNPNRAYGGGFSAKDVAAAIGKALKTKAIGFTLAKNAEPFVNWKQDEMWMAEEYYRGKVEQAMKLGEDATVDGYSLQHWKFLQRAAEEGVLGAQKHNELLALRKHAQFGPRTSKAVAHYMALFTATEEYNRTITGLAAFDLFYKEALAGGLSKDAAEEAAYAKSIKAIYDTQGEYNQINRPKLFRSDLGSLVFLYKTFVITTLEMLRNLPPKGRAVFLGSLFAMSGLGGIPLLDEIWILLDFASQKTGVGLGITKGNAEREFAAFARTMGEAIGWKDFDQVAMRGVMDTYLGTEIFGRAGVQVGIPMIGALRPGAKLMEEVGKSFGAFGGAIEGADKAADKLLRGDFEGATRAVPITAVKNFADAYSYLKYDAVMNKRGQVALRDPSTIDVMARAAGFYPSELKWVNDQVRREEYTRAYAKEMKNAFVEEYREAVVTKDAGRKAEILEMVRDHNETFRGTALEMIDFRQSAEKSGKEAALTLRERAQKTLSKAQQRDSALQE